MRYPKYHAYNPDNYDEQGNKKEYNTEQYINDTLEEARNKHKWSRKKKIGVYFLITLIELALFIFVI